MKKLFRHIQKKIKERKVAKLARLQNDKIWSIAEKFADSFISEINKRPIKNKLKVEKEAVIRLFEERIQNIKHLEGQKEIVEKIYKRFVEQLDIIQKGDVIRHNFMVSSKTILMNSNCPNCENPMLITGVFFGHEYDSSCHYCINCGKSWSVAPIWEKPITPLGMQIKSKEKIVWKEIIQT